MKTFLKRLAVRLYLILENLVVRHKYSNIRNKYDISETFKFNGKNIQMYGEGKIIIGDNTYIGENSSLQAADNCKIEIGNYCAISHNVRIYTKTYVSDQNFCRSDRLVRKGDVTIGDGVWIGVNVFINPGVNIGSNVIIGKLCSCS